jgi:RsmE family RNA methyltransferase
MKKILEHGTTYGVHRFHFYKATLSEKSYLDSKIFEAASIEEHTKLGLSQSTIYAKIPSVTTYKYNPAKNFESDSQNFILDLNGKETFMEQKINFDLPIALSVGPERGFTREDINHFTNAGFKSIKISKTVLRVEHAIYSALAQLELIKNDF